MGEEKKKRNRSSRNTSSEQYELYLQFMESDYNFRSGTVNPTLGDNYLKNKWTELANKLNLIGCGAHMTGNEWKKRSAEWKYATRSIYRKLAEHRLKTGSGPQSDIKLTDLEERALVVWGKFAVTGSPFVGKYEGIPITIRVTNIENPGISEGIISNDDNIDIVMDESLNINKVELVDPETNPNLERRENDKNPETSIIKNNENTSSVETEDKQEKGTRRLGKFNNKRPRPLANIAESLIQSNNILNTNISVFNNSMKSFAEEYIKMEQEKLKLEKQKFEFEVSKYKYEHPDFSLD